MAFARTVAHATAADGTFSAAGATAWNGTSAHTPAVSDATSGGIPYFSSTTTEASSALLAQYGVVLGGGAGAAPYTSAGLAFGGAAAGTGLYVAAGTATTDVNALSLTQTWNNGAVVFTALNIAITKTASATSYIANWLVGGTQKFSVNEAGVLNHITALAFTGNGSITLGAAGYIQYGNRGFYQTVADGVPQIANDAGTGFGRLILGENSATQGIAIKKSTLVMQARLGDDSAFTDFEAKDVITNNAAALVSSNTTLTDQAGVATGTLTNAPAAGNPTKWIAIDDNGTTRKIPCW